VVMVAQSRFGDNAEDNWRQCASHVAQQGTCYVSVTNAVQHVPYVALAG